MPVLTGRSVHSMTPTDDGRMALGLAEGGVVFVREGR